MSSSDATSSIEKENLLTGKKTEILRKVSGFLGHSFLFFITAASAAGILFILLFIFRDALPFFQDAGVDAFFKSDEWYPTRTSPQFGALGIFLATGLVTLGAGLICVPMGVTAAVCLSDVLPFGARQVIKPVIELLAAIPSVAYGFFALIVFAPFLQNQGGRILTVIFLTVTVPMVVLASIVLSEVLTSFLQDQHQKVFRNLLCLLLLGAGGYGIYLGSVYLLGVEISSGVNALNASFFLALMALPTVVSVCEDALTAVGRNIREGSYALGATRAETMVKVVIPAAKGGILAAILLGVMRAVGETMVVVMAAGKAPQIPHPWFNLLSPVRPITATIAIEMAEVARGTLHYHGLFALGFILLLFSFGSNLLSEWSIRRTRKKLGG